MADAAALISDAVRAGDNDRYLSALYAPQDKRAALLALYAFNLEIAGVRDRIHEPMPGEIRLQWWRDILADSAAPEASGHPVADMLMATIRNHRLPQRGFENYLEARIFDLYDDPMPSRSDLEGYCGETVGALIQLSALILDPKVAPAFADAAGHAGCAEAICGLLQRLPAHRARGQCYLPRDMLAAAGTTPEEFVAGNSPEAASRSVMAMIALANEHFAAFQGGASALPATLRPAFLRMALVPAYLAKMSGEGGGILTAPIRLPVWKRHWLLFRAATKGW